MLNQLIRPIGLVMCVAALLTAPRTVEAQADAQEVCRPSKVLPDEGAVVPANLGMIGFFPGMPSLVSAEPPSLTLVDETGAAIPLEANTDPLARFNAWPVGDQVWSLGGLEPFQLWKIAEPLQENSSYVLVRSNPCGPVSEDGVPSSELVATSFRTGAASAFPTSLGSVSATASVRKPVATAESSGVPAFDAAYADIVLAVDPTLAPFDSVTQFAVAAIDGKPLTSGEGSAGVAVEPTAGQTRTFRIFRSCSAIEIFHPILNEGSHDVEIVGKVLGMPTDLPSLRVNVTVTCGKPDHGCALSQQPGARPGLWMLALAPLLILGWRRRR